MEPVSDLLIGGAFGAVLGEILKAIVGLIERGIHFNGVLEDIKSNLTSLADTIEKLTKFSDFLDRPENTNNIREQISKGNRLIQKCDTLKNSRVLIKHLKAPSYTKKLRNFDAALRSASHSLTLQLIVELMRNGPASGSNCQRCRLRLILHKIKIKLLKGLGMSDRCCCRDHDASVQTNQTHLQLHFYDHNQLRGVEKRGKDQYEINFHRSFETVAGEELQNWFICDFTDLSTMTTTTTTTTTTSTHPVKGVLYVSNQKLAFCSNKRIHNPQCKTKKLYLKVIIPFELVKGVSAANSYIELSCVHDQLFTFTKLLNYDQAKQSLQEVPITRATRAIAALL